MASFRVAGAEHRVDALEVWRAASTARGRPPSPARVRRVAGKLDDATAGLVIGEDNNAVIAMALAEPGREKDGRGATQPGVGHISMVFVAPDRWGQGIGTQLLEALHHEMRARGWTTSSLWTGRSNVRAQRLYEGRGYRATGDTQDRAGEEIVRYQLHLVEDT